MTTLLREMGRALRADLWTAASQPLPPLTRPRWLARLPHVLVIFIALLMIGYLEAESGWLPGAMVLAAALPLALFRPVPAWWLVIVTTSVGPLVADTPHPWGWSTVALHAGVLFLLALRVRPRAVVAALSIGVAAGLVTTGLGAAFGARGTVGLDAVRAAVMLTLAAALGALLRSRRLSRLELAAQQQRVTQELGRRTLLEERSRIARELHDVVAHHLSVISIQAQVAVHLVPDPPAEFREHLAGIRANAVEALIELRRVLGVLRLEHEGDPSRHTPQPTLDRLGELVDNVRRAGLAVTTDITGDRRPLAPGVELSAFRIVQEALSNVIRHAPGAPVHISVVYRPEELELRVVNTAATRPAPPSPGAGHGVLGMRERITMLGGRMTSGPTDDGGFEVFASLPTVNPESPEGRP
jgi:signal transduction histidine kinase